MYSDILYDFNFYKARLQIEGNVKAMVLLFIFNRGFQLILSIRLQKAVAQVPLVGAFVRRVIWYLTNILTSSEVSFCATFGKGVYFPHTVGVVIGENWDIGSRVTIMQGVTLGRKYSHLAPSARSVIGDDVMVSCGAKLIGELFVGNNAVIGANAVVLDSVPDGAVAVGIPARIVQRKNEL